MTTLLLLAALLAGPTEYKEYDVTLIKCYDGDTCTFDFNLGMNVVLKDQQVRLCDIDTPEIRPYATREAAKESRARLLSLMKNAKVLKVQVPQKDNCEPGLCDKRGKYGRVLVKIYADKVLVNEVLVIEGLAKRYIECD